MDSTERPSRFRRLDVRSAATPAERARQIVGDGEQLTAHVSESIGALVGATDYAGIIDLMDVVRQHPDPNRVYGLHRAAASLLLAAAAAADNETMAWARWHDTVMAILVPQLEQNPHEPELLNLLGIACYEVGSTRLARRLFEAVRTLEPEHAQARGNLKNAKARLQRNAALPAVDASFTPHLQQLHSKIKRLAERAVRLKTQSVSLIMIVKDEEEMLPGCLAAVAEHVDQLVIVDTGSSDRTREIALEYGATVVDFPWTGSFADARNESLRHATGDWIIWLDADEHMVDTDGLQLRQLARKVWIEGFYLVETHYTGEAEIGSQTTHTPLRMFRRRPEYQWEGIVHEQITHLLPNYLPERFQPTSVRVNHYGYLKGAINDRAKRERNMQLLLQQVMEGKTSFICFNLGSEYAAVHDWQRAYTWFEEALTLAREEDGWTQSQFAPLLVSRAITSRREMGLRAEAYELAAEMLKRWPDFTDLVFEQALCLFGQGRSDEALDFAQRCVVMGDAPARYVAVEGRGSHQARSLVAMLLRRAGRPSEALEQLEVAIRSAPHFTPLLLDLVDTLLELGDPQEAERRVQEHVDDTASATAHLLVGSAFHAKGVFDAAERSYRHVLEQNPDNPLALVALAELQLGQHRFADAADTSARVADDEHLLVRAARSRFLAAVVEASVREEHLQAAFLQLVGAGEALPIGERLFYAGWMTTLRGAPPVVAPDPDAARACIANLDALAKLGAAAEFERLISVFEVVLPDEQERRLQLGELYVRRQFVDMAAEELLGVVEKFGPSPRALAGLGKIATMQEMWEDAELLLTGALELDPDRADAKQLLQLLRAR